MIAPTGHPLAAALRPSAAAPAVGDVAFAGTFDRVLGRQRSIPLMAMAGADPTLPTTADAPTLPPWSPVGTGSPADALAGPAMSVGGASLPPAPESIGFSGQKGMATVPTQPPGGGAPARPFDGATAFLPEPAPFLGEPVGAPGSVASRPLSAADASQSPSVADLLPALPDGSPAPVQSAVNIAPVPVAGHSLVSDGRPVAPPATAGDPSGADAVADAPAGPAHPRPVAVPIVRPASLMGSEKRAAGPGADGMAAPSSAASWRPLLRQLPASDAGGGGESTTVPDGSVDPAAEAVVPAPIEPFAEPVHAGPDGQPTVVAVSTTDQPASGARVSGRTAHATARTGTDLDRSSDRPVPANGDRQDQTALGLILPFPVSAPPPTTTTDPRAQPSFRNARVAADRMAVGDRRPTEAGPGVAGPVVGGPAPAFDAAALGLLPGEGAAPARAESGRAAAAPVASQTPVAHQLDLAGDAQWLARLTQDIAATTDPAGQLRFALAPERLGRLDVQLAVGSDGATVALTAETREAHRLLSEAQPQFLAEARAQGLRLADVRVDVAPAPHGSTGGAGPGAHQSFANQNGGGGSQPQRDRAAPRAPAPAVRGARAADDDALYA